MLYEEVESMEKIQEKIFLQITKFKNIPIDIEYLWCIINTRDKFLFIQAFHEMPKIYSSVYLKYKSGVPFLLYTEKDLWEFIDSRFIPLEKDIHIEKLPIESKITLEELVDFHVRSDYPEMDSDLMNKILEVGNIHLLEMILCERPGNFDFSDKDYNDFLNRLVEINQKENRMEMILLIMRTKYRNKIKTLETHIDDLKRKKSDLNHQLNVYKSDLEKNKKTFLQKLFYF